MPVSPVSYPPIYTQVNDEFNPSKPSDFIPYPKGIFSQDVVNFLDGSEAIADGILIKPKYETLIRPESSHTQLRYSGLASHLFLSRAPAYQSSTINNGSFNDNKGHITVNNYGVMNNGGTSSAHSTHITERDSPAQISRRRQNNDQAIMIAGAIIFSGLGLGLTYLLGRNINKAKVDQSHISETQNYAREIENLQDDYVNHKHVGLLKNIVELRAQILNNISSKRNWNTAMIASSLGSTVISVVGCLVAQSNLVKLGIAGIVAVTMVAFYRLGFNTDQVQRAVATQMKQVIHHLRSEKAPLGMVLPEKTSASYYSQEPRFSSDGLPTVHTSLPAGVARDAFGTTYAPQATKQQVKAQVNVLPPSYEQHTYAQNGNFKASPFVQVNVYN